MKKKLTLFFEIDFYKKDFFEIDFFFKLTLFDFKSFVWEGNYWYLVLSLLLMVKVPEKDNNEVEKEYLVGITLNLVAKGTSIT